MENIDKMYFPLQYAEFALVQVSFFLLSNRKLFSWHDLMLLFKIAYSQKYFVVPYQQFFFNIAFMNRTIIFSFCQLWHSVEKKNSFMLVFCLFVCFIWKHFNAMRLLLGWVPEIVNNYRGLLWRKTILF